MISPSDWASFRAAMMVAHNSFNQQDIVWNRMTSNLDRFGEDGDGIFEQITLKGLVYYNFARTWIVNRPTQSGMVDEESSVVILNKDYLESLGYLNEDGYFAFNPGYDLFDINGVRYKPAGDTDADQAGQDPTLFFLILKREPRNTGDKVYA